MNRLSWRLRLARQHALVAAVLLTTTTGPGCSDQGNASQRSTSASGTSGGSAEPETAGRGGNGATPSSAGASGGTSLGGDAAGGRGGSALGSGGAGTGDAGATASSGAGRSSAGAGGSGVPFNADTQCELYCGAFDVACLGEELFEQYRNHRECVAVCRLKPPGSMSDTSGDTMGCRFGQALRAQTMVETDPDYAQVCAAAGPTGGGVCGSICEGYCSLVVPVCRDAPSDRSGYGSMEQCLTACASMKSLEVPYNWGRPSMYFGDSVQCRTAHAANQADDHYASSDGVSEEYFHCQQAREQPLSGCK